MTDKLAAKRIFNAYGFYGTQPYISWSANGGRSVLPSWWAVHKRGVDLGGAWYDNGAKTFSGKKRDVAALEEAKRWAFERFNITKWMRDPFGGYGDATYITQRLAELMAGSVPPSKECTCKGIK